MSQSASFSPNSQVPIEYVVVLSRLNRLRNRWKTVKPSLRSFELESLRNLFPPPPLPHPLPQILLESLSTFFPSQALSSLTTPFLDALFGLISIATNGTETIFPSPSIQFSSAHLIHCLLEISRHHPEPSLRLKSLNSLHSLLLCLPHDLTAAFLPGLFSALLHILTNAATKRPAHINIALKLFRLALDCFPKNLPSTTSTPTTLAHVLASKQSKAPPSSSSSSSPQSSDTNPAQPPPAPRFHLLKTRDEEWASRVGAELQSRLSTVFLGADPPVAHESPLVRKELAILCTWMIQNLHLLKMDSKMRDVLALVLIELKADDFKQVADRVGDQVLPTSSLVGALKGVVSVVLAKAKGKGRVEVMMTDILSARSEECWIKMAEGLLKYAIIGGEGTIKHVIGRVGAENICALMQRLLEATWKIGLEGESGKEEIRNSILNVAVDIGNCGALSALYSELGKQSGVDGEEVEDVGEARMLLSFKSRARAVLLMISLIRGELSRNQRKDEERAVYLKYITQYVKEILEITTYFFVPCLEKRFSKKLNHVDDLLLSMKQCMLSTTSNLLEEFGRVTRSVSGLPVGSSVVLIVIMSLLKDATNGDKTVQDSAHLTLRKLATVAKCSSERQLLRRHLNFIISRMTDNLEEEWAADILRFIVSNKPDEVSREATMLLKITLGDICNQLAGSTDDRALHSLKAVKSVLSSAVALKEPLAEAMKSLNISDERDETKVHVTEGELERLRKRLMFYCADQVPDAMVSEEQVDEDNDDKETRDPFEALALTTLDGMRDMLGGRPWRVRAEALECASLAVQLLSGNEKELLPHAANLLELIPDQFVILHQEKSARERLLDNMKARKLRGRQDAEDIEDLVGDLNKKGAQLPTVTNACLLLSALAKGAGHFIRYRFVKLIYPKMRPLIRLASCFPTLVGRNDSLEERELISKPSHGAMAASDACLEAICSMSTVVPESLIIHAMSLSKHLAVYFDEHNHPDAQGQRNNAHLNRGMLRYERERWNRRVYLARITLNNLKRVSSGRIISGLLSGDRNVPACIESTNDWLNSVSVSNFSRATLFGGVKPQHAKSSNKLGWL